MLMKMFTLIDIGERAGSGIPNIYSIWNKRDGSAPTISEEFDPERITLSLPLKKLVLRNYILSTALLEYYGLINEKTIAKIFLINSKRLVIITSALFSVVKISDSTVSFDLGAVVPCAVSSVSS